VVESSVIYDPRWMRVYDSRWMRAAWQPTGRREFLTRCLAAVVAPAGALADGRLIAVRPLLGTREPPPFNRLLGRGLDARQFFDLSTLAPDKLIVPASEFYVRTAAPSAVSTPRWLETLRRREGDQGEVLLECAGNSDPSSFGLISAARWSGIPIEAALDMAGPPRKASLVLIGGADEHPPSQSSRPGASWIFSIDQLVAARAFVATTMNGAVLTAVHGAPTRLVVPGWYGCAAIKWVNAIEFVGDDEPPTSQMREFAVRTFQNGQPALARDYRPVVIEHAATPVRVEQWMTGGQVVYRVVGILWGGSRPTNRLAIRFGSREPWVAVESCPLPATTRTWALWSHTWRPAARGRYRIALRVDDRELRTDRLDMFFYVRDVEIEQV
jgi:DMSO/TMAO reductase YedYZ molybdopterin-dependent catalytic subunit